MADALRGKVWVRHITNPLTVQVLTKFVTLWERLEQEVQLMPDTFSWTLIPDG
jgi:hypothetical protein